MRYETLVKPVNFNNDENYENDINDSINIYSDDNINHFLTNGVPLYGNGNEIKLFKYIYEKDVEYEIDDNCKRINKQIKLVTLYNNHSDKFYSILNKLINKKDSKVYLSSLLYI